MISKEQIVKSESDLALPLSAGRNRNAEFFMDLAFIELYPQKSATKIRDLIRGPGSVLAVRLTILLKPLCASRTRHSLRRCLSACVSSNIY